MNRRIKGGNIKKPKTVWLLRSAEIWRPRQWPSHSWKRASSAGILCRHLTASNKACPGSTLWTFGSIAGDSCAQEELQNHSQHSLSRSKQTTCNPQTGEHRAAWGIDGEGEITATRCRQENVFPGKDYGSTSREHYIHFWRPEHLHFPLGGMFRHTFTSNSCLRYWSPCCQLYLLLLEDGMIH